MYNLVECCLLIHRLQRFEKTNEMLVNCNALSQSRLKQANEDFRKHCKVLGDMKKDLDYIFRKIRNIKQRLGQQYPIAFAEAQPQRSSLAEEAEDETEVRNAAANAVQQKEDQKLKMKSTGMNVDTASATTATGTVTTTATTNTTVEYVQMEEMIDNGKPIDNELIKRVCSLETPNPNDSSDCTSEDTA